MNNQQPVFQVLVSDGSTTQDVLGLWDIDQGEPTFGSQPATSQDIGTLWRVVLPEDPGETNRLLTGRMDQHQEISRFLPAAERSLERDLISLKGYKGGVDFSFQDGQDHLGPDSPLGVLVAASQYRYEGTSFGLFDSLRIDSQELESAREEVLRFAGLVRRTVEQFALVETVSGGYKIARTRVAWSGDADSWWGSRADYNQFSNHNQVLAQALATRHNWLQFLLLLTSGVVRTAATLATGPFSLLSIWATWNYLQQLLTSYRKISKDIPPA